MRSTPSLVKDTARRPVRHSAVPRAKVASEVGPCGDRLELLVPRYKGPFFDRLLRKVVPHRHQWERYPLDTRGSRIWSLIDGARDVTALVERYRDIYPEDDKQVPNRVMSFLHILEKHGFVDFVSP